MNVATAYPVQTQADGRYWFRTGGGPQDGWTADPTQAHPDYQVVLGTDGTAITWQGDPWAAAPSTPQPQESNVDQRGAVPQLPGEARPAVHATNEHRPGERAVVPPVASGSDGGAVMSTDAFAGPGPRTTRWAGYPLPPLLPRAVHKHNQYGHYVLPDPITNLPTGFVRATTAAKTLDDTYNLSRWSTRTQVASLLRLVDTVAAEPGNAVATSMLTDLRQRIGQGNGSTVNDLLEEINGFNGGNNASEFGDAVHEWCAALDASMVLLRDVPETFLPWVTAYQRVLAKAGLVAVAQYVERVVLNDSGIERVVGTLDRLFMCVATGELYLGDLKTSKADNVKWSWMTWPTQLVGYARASHMLAMLGGAWEPMPPVNQDVGLLVHLPSDAPQQANILALKLAPADQYMATSLTARHHRKNAKHDVPGVAPVPTAQALRYVAAYQAIQGSHGVDDLNAVWDQYQDVWRPELTELGHAVAQLFTASAPA